jgi:hypothetical protein
MTWKCCDRTQENLWLAGQSDLQNGMRLLCPEATAVTAAAGDWQPY